MDKKTKRNLYVNPEIERTVLWKGWGCLLSHLWVESEAFGHEIDLLNFLEK